ncbi:MAG: glycoside hydrolase family 28 protein [Emticicia sp.]|uniref:glycoside hydrolase family 28 protein n=1 Tax=Emticicia sp. TaxID=1930953 RepID=UPI003BA474AA
MSKKTTIRGYLLVCLISIAFTDSFAQYNIISFGAKADGKTLNTQAIQKAIDEASAKGGGKVIFPKGRFLSGTLLLKSGVELFLEKDAILLGSSNPADYPKIDLSDTKVSTKTDDNSKLALIWAYRAKNIGISGVGTIDGQGRGLALHIDSLHHTGAVIDPNYRRRPSETVRPKIINMLECEHIKVEGITIINSASWVQTYELSADISIKNLKVNSTAYWNNDGINITDSKNVIIENCDVNAADDGITLKSYFPDKYSDNVVIRNCKVRSSASAVKFGTASFGGFKNVVIENIYVYDTYRSAVALEAVDGGFIENITVKNITAVNTGNAFFLRLGHRAGERAGYFKNVSIKNVKAQIPFGRPDINYDLRGPALDYFHNIHPVVIAGIPDSYIQDITIENVEITYPGRASKAMAYMPIWRLDAVPEKINSYPEYTMFGELPSWGFYVRHANGILFKNVKLNLENSDFRPAFVFDDVRNIQIEKITLPKDKVEQIILKNSKSTKLDLNIHSFVKEL